jgi:hypothetical protein
MREGRSGIYVGSNGALGYSVCMLDKTQMNSRYRDPYLSAIHRESNVGSDVDYPWFTGYETEPRRMSLKSGAKIQCVEDGFLLHPPQAAAHAATFLKVCASHAVGADQVLRVPQVESEGRKLDTLDRVSLGAALLSDLVAAGL